MKLRYTLREEDLYVRQRIKDLKVEDLYKVIKGKDDKIEELRHENRRLCDQTKIEKAKVLIEHLTVETMTDYPVMVDSEAQNTVEMQD